MKTDEEIRQDKLRRLLLRMFSVEELRRFVRFLPGGQDMILELPAQNETPSITATAIVQVLLQENAITKDFFERLIAERPRREDEIREIQTAFLATGDAQAINNVLPIKARS